MTERDRLAWDMFVRSQALVAVANLTVQAVAPGKQLPELNLEKAAAGSYAAADTFLAEQERQGGGDGGVAAAGARKDVAFRPALVRLDGAEVRGLAYGTERDARESIEATAALGGQKNYSAARILIESVIEVPMPAAGPPAALSPTPAAAIEPELL